MRKWIFLFIIIGFAIFEVAILDYVNLGGVKPDLFLVSAVMVGLSFNFELSWALFLSIFSGILKDILTINPFAVNTVLFPLWTFLVIKLSRKISIDNHLLRGLLLGLVIVFNAIVTRLLFLSLTKIAVSLGIFLKIAFLEALYTAIVSIFIFSLLERLKLNEDF